jgi:hypothetical protein
MSSGRLVKTVTNEKNVNKLNNNATNISGNAESLRRKLKQLDAGERLNTASDEFLAVLTAIRKTSYVTYLYRVKRRSEG